MTVAHAKMEVNLVISNTQLVIGDTIVIAGKLYVITNIKENKLDSGSIDLTFANGKETTLCKKRSSDVCRKT